MSNPKIEYDVVVVGSGAAALSAAIASADAGLQVLMAEGSDRWGGSSAMSGGGMWLPNNRLMQRDGAADSREEALDYLEQTVGDAGPAATPQRRAAFVDNVAGFVDLAIKHDVRLVRGSDYPDYYPELPGGKIGRVLEVEPFDTKRIRAWWPTSRGQDGVPAPVKTDDFWLLQRAWSSPAGFARGARVVGRTLGSLVIGQRKVGMGAALTCSLLEVALRLGVRVWLDAPVLDLVLDGDRVVGARLGRGGEEVEVSARRGVVLASGGFDHNADWRELYQGVDGSASSGAASNLGGGISAAQRAGAALDLMDDAWWGASIPPSEPGGSASFLVSERSVPHCLIVDASGRRFANESESYVDLGHHMLARQAETPGKFWMISDHRHALKYLRSYALDPRAVKRLKAAGSWHTSSSLAGLAAAVGLPSADLLEQVGRFNGFAKTGIDQDFGRGNSAYDRYYSDPLCHPNPNLGTIEKAPFTAIELVPGDLGTKGGVVTDVRARALRTDGSIIRGLYAAGNCSASVMGRTYPGPGSTLGPACVFGYIAARQLATNDEE